MGLSIHYSGKIKDAGLIPLLVDEVQDVCTILKWNYHLYDDKTVKGISFSASMCEPVFLTFSNGVLCSPPLLHFNVYPATTISTKTQFAGIDVHRAIIKLLRHLKEVYFEEFELMDEGHYWETDSEEILQQQFDKYTHLLNKVTTLLQEFKANKKDTPDTLANQIVKYLNDRLGRSES